MIFKTCVKLISIDFTLLHGKYGLRFLSHLQISWSYLTNFVSWSWVGELETSRGCLMSFGMPFQGPFVGVCSRKWTIGFFKARQWSQVEFVNSIYKILFDWVFIRADFGLGWVVFLSVRICSFSCFSFLSFYHLPGDVLFVLPSFFWIKIPFYL